MGNRTEPINLGRAIAGALICALACVGLALPAAAPAASLPAGFQERTIATGLTWPTAVDWTPDGRMLVAQQGGQVKVFNPGSSTAATALDLSSIINSYGDRGLLGLEVDSAFESNGYVYLAYTYDVNQISRDQGGPMVSQIRRVKLAPDNTVSEQTVILGNYTAGPCPAPSNAVDCIPSDGLSHSIGTIRSAPDGSLFIGSGDAADYNYADPLALRTYDERSLAGKIMRVDRNGQGLAGHSFCPGQQNLTLACTKLYAKGLRNPFRFTLRPDGTTLMVADVGWGTKEEINIIRQGGGNYGWPCYEGTIKPGGYRDMAGCAAQYANEGTSQAAIAPNYDYNHEAKWSEYAAGAIVGGPTYAGTTYPAVYNDAIFFGDYALGFLKYGKLDSSDHVTGIQTMSEDWFGVDLENAPDGNLVWSSIDQFETGAGHIAKAVYTGGSNHQPVARATATPTSGSAPLDVTFTGGASTDPDGDTLTYSWNFGDGATANSANPVHRYAAAGTFTATLTVSDGRGGTGTDTITISSGNDAPTPTINSPAASLQYAAGDTITLSGSGTDPEDGALPGSAFSWSVTLVHGEHTHPITSITGTASTTFAVRDDHDADSFYRIALTATDSGGNSVTTTREIRPRTRALSLDSQPSGATISYAGYDKATPWSEQAAVGFKTTISAPATFAKAGVNYEFDRWSDGGARSHDITVPDAATTLTAIYRQAATPPPAGLIAAYGFDQTSGTSAPDSSGRGHTGDVRGATWVAGKSGGGLDFDGIDDWMTVADANDLDVTTALTLEAWVKPDNLKPFQTVAMKETSGNQAYGLYATDGGNPGKANAGIGDDGTWAPGPLPAAQWSHLAMTLSGGTLRLYVNGALVDSAPAAAAAASTGALRIGGNNVWAGEFFGGAIDDVRLYSRALTASEIGTDMQTPVSGVPPVDPPPVDPPPPPPPPPPPASANLVAEYTFDDASGTQAADSSGRGHTGTISGGAGWSAAGKHGGAINLDGVNDMVTIADAGTLDLTDAMTFEAWVRPDTLKPWQTVLLKEAPGDVAYALYATGGGSAQANGWIGTRGVYSPTATKASRWTHFAVTYDGSRARIYMDGVLKATGTNVPKPPVTAGALRIGGNNVWSGEQFDGLIDEVRLYKRALSATEIAADMNSATATAARRRTVKSPNTGKACVSPGTTRNRTKLTRSLRTKKVKICADKPHKTRRR